MANVSFRMLGPWTAAASLALALGLAPMPSWAGGGGPGRPGALTLGAENVNDSPLKASNYRQLLRFVPRADLQIDRVYFGFKLKGAKCWDTGDGYGAGDGGTMLVRLVDIDAATGLPAGQIASETVNGCTRHNQAKAEVRNETPVLAWATLRASLKAGKMYGLVISNEHPDPARNFFSFNAPIGDATLAGPHGRNELNKDATDALLSLDPREHVAWSEDSGKTWRYGKANGQYASYMNDRDQAHPATRLPQYGFRLTSGINLPAQPYYAYTLDCANCTVAYGNLRVARSLTEAGGFTAGGAGIGTLTVKNLSTGQESSCTPYQGYGFNQCSLARAVPVQPGQVYSITATGSVELMKMDYSMRLLFPQVGHDSPDFPAYQPSPRAGTNREDVPSLWAGPLSPLVASEPSSNWSRQIEAESFTAQQGVQTEACTEGGLNVGWIDATDWMVYGQVNFPGSGTYRVDYRVASPGGATLSLDLNGGAIRLGTVDIPATGGWQTWRTVSQTVTINAGTYDVGVYAPKGGWNLNWIRFTKL
ncbi:carbohydrate-binding protein [Roseateles chitinivorans]|uniref:carbohydrate-binding protein n=1 Tax=Roseateles chitinivorans TaxID=2917965 RepID=UPI003D6780E2